MRIAVYLGSTLGNDEKYKKLTLEIANWMTSHKYDLVYGAGRSGLMGVLAEEVFAHGGSIVGVMPKFLLEKENLFADLDELYMVDTMSSRKQKMIDLAQGFVALPGGPGTLEEICEIISLVRLKQIHHPCVLLNQDGYYEPLRQMLLSMVDAGFMPKDGLKDIHFVESIEELDEAFHQ